MLRTMGARFLSFGEVEREETQDEHCCLIGIGGFQDIKIDTKINTDVSAHVCLCICSYTYMHACLSSVH